MEARAAVAWATELAKGEGPVWTWVSLVESPEERKGIRMNMIQASDKRSDFQNEFHLFEPTHQENLTIQNHPGQ